MKELIYVIITPVRDEEKHIQETIRSVTAQTHLPAQWIIVNDGSTDKTGSLIDKAAQQFSWITAVHRPNRGYRKSGGGVIEAFYDGYSRLISRAWDFLVKLDGDLSFASNYFESCFHRFESNPKLGIGGGVISSICNGHAIIEGKSDPKFHVRGATKIYRKQCWEAIGDLIRSPGWDTLDELKANMLGWQTGSFEKLTLTQHRPTGMADGSWKNWVKNGYANYIVGYHPLFMFFKCIKRCRSRPYGIVSVALGWGFLKGYFQATPHGAGKEVVRYVRRQQLQALLLKPSLWNKQNLADIRPSQQLDYSISDDKGANNKLDNL